jgi:hypothetical protein
MVREADVVPELLERADVLAVELDQVKKRRVLDRCVAAHLERPSGVETRVGMSGGHSEGVVETLSCLSISSAIRADPSCASSGIGHALPLARASESA